MSHYTTRVSRGVHDGHIENIHAHVLENLVLRHTLEALLHPKPGFSPTGEGARFRDYDL
jgi:hypothetical protein